MTVDEYCDRIKQRKKRFGYQEVCPSCGAEWWSDKSDAISTLGLADKLMCPYCRTTFSIAVNHFDRY